MCMHALKMSLLPTAPADSVGAQRRQSAQGGQKNPLKPWARRNKSSATMKRSDENTAQWVPSLTIKSVWFTPPFFWMAGAQIRWWSLSVSRRRWQVVYYVSRKKKRETNCRASVAQWAPSCQTASWREAYFGLVLWHEGVMLIVHADWSLWAPAAIIHFRWTARIKKLLLLYFYQTHLSGGLTLL